VNSLAFLIKAKRVAFNYSESINFIGSLSNEF